MTNPRLRLVIILLLLLLWSAANLLFYQTTILSGSPMRYMILPWVLLAVLLMIGTRFVRTFYQLQYLSHAGRYLGACLFGINYPSLLVSDGMVQVKEGEENLVMAIGGPGKIEVLAGNVALVEETSAGVRVLGPGTHFINPRETIKEITLLDERYQPIEMLSARSKDGIEVASRDIRYRYRVSSHMEGKALQSHGLGTMFRFTPEAIVTIAYSRAQSASGKIGWEEEIRKTVESVITEFIQRHQVDYLIAPISLDADPRAEIYREFYSPAGKKRFQEKGAELIWIDIGHFETPEQEVAQQRVTTWRTKWMGTENGLQDSTQAQRFGKLEAESEILMNVLESLGDPGLSGDDEHQNRPLVLARIAQLIDSMREQRLSEEQFMGSEKDE